MSHSGNEQKRRCFRRSETTVYRQRSHRRTSRRTCRSSEDYPDFWHGEEPLS